MVAVGTVGDMETGGQWKTCKAWGEQLILNDGIQAQGQVRTAEIMPGKPIGWPPGTAAAIPLIVPWLPNQPLQPPAAPRKAVAQPRTKQEKNLDWAILPTSLLPSWWSYTGD